MDPITAGLMMGGGSLISGLGGLLGSNTQANASRSAGQMGWLGAILAGQAADQGYQRAQTALSPYSTAGQGALSTLMSYLTGNNAQAAGIGGGGPNLMSTFAPTQAQLESTPGYQFQLSQGTKAAQNAAAAKGLGSSGNAIQSGVDYATGLAGTTFQQQLQNYMLQNQQAYNMLWNPSQMGQGAAGGIANAAMSAAGMIGNAAMGAGNALGQGIANAGAATAAGTNALFGGMGNALTYGGYYGGGMNKPSIGQTTTNYGMQSPAFQNVVGGAGPLAVPTLY